VRLKLAVLLAVLVAAAVPAIGASPAPGASSAPSGSAEITEGGTENVSAAGTGSAHVRWSATCPNPAGEKTHYWYVNSTAYHQDGSHANHQSTAESSATSDSKVHGLVLQMAPGLLSETFRVQVTLSCFPNPDTVIGNLSITLIRPGGATSGPGAGAGGGSGSGGGGSGGTGGPGGTGGSGAPVQCVVPKLAGRTLKRAKRMLEAAHCKLGTVTSPKHRKGAKLVVRSSAPKHGARLPRDAKVKVRLRRA
jgi:hypothetical protein